MPSNAIFISYRRSASWSIAQLIHSNMVSNNIDAFLDTDNLASGKFLQNIFEEIAARPYFLPILTPGTLDRCIENGDVLRKEFDEAIRLKRVIVPLYTAEFKWDDLKKFVPDIADEIQGFNAIELPKRFFSHALMELRQRYLLPIDIDPRLTPADTSASKEKPDGVTVTQKVLEKQLTAEEYFARGQKKHALFKFDGAIADYNEALRLKPEFALAHYKRGAAYSHVGYYDAAIVDFTKALELNPKLIDAYIERGHALHRKNNPIGAMSDFIEALRLDPKHTYHTRGNLRFNAGDYFGAIADFTEALRLDPTNISIYSDRAMVYEEDHNYDGAIADYSKALDVNPNLDYAYLIRGYLFADNKGDYRHAISDLEQYIKLSPDTVDAQEARKDIEKWRKLIK